MDVKQVTDIKARILASINHHGPSYPTKLARELGTSPLFIAAFMSELVNEQKLKMSSMKVGSSPLYIAPGQEPQLENFIAYLGSKEREAFLKLKQASVLNDQEQDPATRIALQTIKDFAMPFNLLKDTQQVKHWRYFTLSESEARSLLEPKKSKEQIKPVKQEPIQNTPKVKKKEARESVYLKKVQDHFASKQAQLENLQSPKAKEYHATLTLETSLGKQRYLTIIKEKKKLTEEDIALALHKAQAEKMPALIISPGTPDKAAQHTLDAWKDLVKLEKLL